MNKFLSDSNIYGQNILQLVSRGNAIIAELLRLKDYIPEVFRLESKQDVQKYGEVILDFNYFKIGELQEKKIENNEVLRDIDEQFRDNHIQLINRFYMIFEGIYKYIADLNDSLDELDEGLFIHQTLETVFTDVEGKQLMCEALYLYGVMLLLLDAYIDGSIRERLLVSYYRYTPQRRDGQYAIDEVCKLLRDTGYSSSKKPNNYPEDYFKRVSIKSSYVDLVIGHLRSDDIYNQLSVYSLPKHRSTALSTQASMLFVCLYFCPNILHLQNAVMREIVDKYFPDNWVISIYMGYTMNIVEWWEGFKAARTAINNTSATQNIKFHASLHSASVINLIKMTSNYLKEGNAIRGNLMNDINTIVNLLKDCNVTLRWLMLHILRTESNKKCKHLQDIAINEAKYDPIVSFKLLLNTAQLEVIIKDIVKSVLEEKAEKWETLKKDCCERLVELSDVFGATKPLMHIQKNIDLKNWFTDISKRISSLSQDSPSSGKKIIRLIQALEEVQEFHQLEKNMHIIQMLSEIRSYLHQMLQTMNIKEDVLIMLHIITDLSYGWILIDSFTPIMQKGIKKEPTLCIKLKAIFLKLATALETPLLRVNQSQSKDLVSVSQYYSNELEVYVRKVLQIIPETMFQELLKIIEIQTEVLKVLPTKMDKDKMKSFAQLNERFQFAELTNSISVYSQGIRMMKNTLVGVVYLDSRKLLEDGIRKEFVQHISKALHFGFNFSQKKGELERSIESLTKIMNGYKRSLEYIQDYININGLKIWQEEVTRIINYYVEQECNTFLRNKIFAWDSKYQNRFVPIPDYSSTDTTNGNFIARLAKEILRLTDPRNAIFVPQSSTWYDIKNNKSIFDKETISSIATAVEIAGLVGLDRLFSFMIIFNLKKVIVALEKSNAPIETRANKPGLGREGKTSTEIGDIKLYQNCINKAGKVWQSVLESVLMIGQLQLLRNLINFHLNLVCRFNAKDLESSLKTLNKALLHIMLKEDSMSLNEELLLSLSKYSDFCGMNKPFNKIYITARYNEQHVMFLFAFMLLHLQKLCFNKNVGAVSKKNQDKVDGITFTVAFHTIFKQFPPNLNKIFINSLTTLAVDLFQHNVGQKSLDAPNETFLILKFLEEYATLSKTSEQIFKESLPEELFYLLDSLYC